MPESSRSRSRIALGLGSPFDAAAAGSSVLTGAIGNDCTAMLSQSIGAAAYAVAPASTTASTTGSTAAASST